MRADRQRLQIEDLTRRMGRRTSPAGDARGVYLGRVYDGGAMPTTDGPGVYLTRPLAIDVDESTLVETRTANTKDSVPVALLAGRLAVGDDVLCRLVQGRWVVVRQPKPAEPPPPPYEGNTCIRFVCKTAYGGDVHLSDLPASAIITRDSDGVRVASLNVPYAADFPGDAAHHLYCAGAPDLTPSGSANNRFWVAAWVYPGGSDGQVAGQWGSDGQRVWRLRVEGTTAFFEVTTDGTSATSHSTSIELTTEADGWRLVFAVVERGAGRKILLGTGTGALNQTVLAADAWGSVDVEFRVGSDGYGGGVDELMLGAWPNLTLAPLAARDSLRNGGPGRLAPSAGSLGSARHAWSFQEPGLPAVKQAAASPIGYTRNLLAHGTVGEQVGHVQSPSGSCFEQSVLVPDEHYTVHTPGEPAGLDAFGNVYPGYHPDTRHFDTVGQDPPASVYLAHKPRLLPIGDKSAYVAFLCLNAHHDRSVSVSLDHGGGSASWSFNHASGPCLTSGDVTYLALPDREERDWILDVATTHPYPCLVNPQVKKVLFSCGTPDVATDPELAGWFGGPPVFALNAKAWRSIAPPGPPINPARAPNVCAGGNTGNPFGDPAKIDYSDNFGAAELWWVAASGWYEGFYFAHGLQIAECVPCGPPSLVPFGLRRTSGSIRVRVRVQLTYTKRPHPFISTFPCPYSGDGHIHDWQVQVNASRMFGTLSGLSSVFYQLGPNACTTNPAGSFCWVPRPEDLAPGCTTPFAVAEVTQTAFEAGIPYNPTTGGWTGGGVWSPPSPGFGVPGWATCPGDDYQGGWTMSAYCS